MSEYDPLAKVRATIRAKVDARDRGISGLADDANLTRDKLSKWLANKHGINTTTLAAMLTTLDLELEAKPRVKGSARARGTPVVRTTTDRNTSKRTQ